MPKHEENRPQYQYGFDPRRKNLFPISRMTLNCMRLRLKNYSEPSREHPSNRKSRDRKHRERENYEPLSGLVFLESARGISPPIAFPEKLKSDSAMRRPTRTKDSVRAAGLL